MKKASALSLSIALSLINTAPALAAESEASTTSQRSKLLFVQRSSFFGLNPIVLPIDPKSNKISDHVRLVGGAMDGQTWRITGDDSLWGAIRTHYLFAADNHPHTNLTGLLSSSDKASAELKLADETATQQNNYLAWGYGLAVLAAIPLSISLSNSSQSPTSNPLFYAGAGLGVASLATAIFSVNRRQESWNHLGRAVKTWNAGE
ncbi:MAG TPA: hypothetical protein V6D00_01605 [Pantanalinema sp.]